MDEESAKRNRARLWLRSERAFGLSAVPWKATEATEATNIAEVAEVDEANGARGEVRRSTTTEQTSLPRASSPPATAQPSRGSGLFGENPEPPTQTNPPRGLVPLPTIEPFSSEVLPGEE